jgi:hypothetical protein
VSLFGKERRKNELARVYAGAGFCFDAFLVLT